MYIKVTNDIMGLSVHKVEDLKDSIIESIESLSRQLLHYLNFKIDAQPYDQKPNLSFDFGCTDSENYQKSQYILKNIDEILNDIQNGNSIEMYTLNDKFNYTLDITYIKNESKFNLDLYSHLSTKPWMRVIQWVE